MGRYCLTVRVQLKIYLNFGQGERLSTYLGAQLPQTYSLVSECNFSGFQISPQSTLSLLHEHPLPRLINRRKLCNGYLLYLQLWTYLLIFLCLNPNFSVEIFIAQIFVTCSPWNTKTASRLWYGYYNLDFVKILYSSGHQDWLKIEHEFQSEPVD